MGELTLSMFFESWVLFRDSVLAGTLAGALLGLMGVYIISKRMVFLSAALSQTSGLGVALAFYAQLHLGISAQVASPTLGAALISFVALAVLMVDRSATSQQRDSLLGLLFLAGACGTLIVGTWIVQEIQDIQTLLFGTAVAVLPEDLDLIVIVCVVLGAVHLVGVRGFTEVAFDPDGSMVRGMPTRTLEAALLITLALAISVITGVLGALPAFAFSVLPAMAAVRLSPNARWAMVLAAIFGASMGFAGYLVAYLYSLPVGAAQTLVGVALVVAVATSKGSIGGVAGWLRRR